MNNYIDRPLGTLNSPVSFTSPFSTIPQVTINWAWVDMDGGVLTYSTKVTSITQNGFILTTFSSNYITQIIIQWMAFLDDNIHSQAGSIVQYITSQIVNPNIVLTNPQAQIPYAAAFLTGVSQTSTTTADNYEYLIMVNSTALTQIQLHINIVPGFAVSQIDYNLIYGSPQYLTAGQSQYNSPGTFPLFTIDARTKVSMAGFSELFGSGRVRLTVANNNGPVTIATWATSSFSNVIISYFNYMPCPLYCTTCYTVAPNCDGCLPSTYRIGSDCKTCQTQTYMITGQTNCSSCQSYCNECSGSATVNCTSCQVATFRINAPSCTTCPSQMFLQSGVINCQQCASYCNQCVGISTACSNCLGSSLRTGAPSCTTCPSQMFIQSGADNCQQCATYCIIVQFFWSGLIRLFVSSSYEICFTICLGLYGLQFENLTFVIKFDLFITIFLIVCYFFNIFLISVIASLDTKTLQQKLNEYGAVCECFKYQYLMKQTLTIISIKKFLFMIFLVLLYNEPLFQILNILALQISQLLFLIILDPISDRKEKQKQVICEFFMLLAEIQLAILVIDDYWILFIYEKRRIFGWICVFALIIIAFSQITIDIHQQGQYYYKRYPVVRKYWGLLKNISSGQPKKQISLSEILI